MWGAIAGTVLGAAGGAGVGSAARDAASKVTLPGAKGPLATPSGSKVNELPMQLRPFGYMGQALGMGVGVTTAPYIAAKHGMKLAPSLVGNFINRITATASRSPGSLAAVEGIGILGAAGAEALSEEDNPGATGQRIASGIGGGMVVSNIPRLALTVGHSIFDHLGRAVESMLPEGRLSAAARLLLEMVDEAGGDADVLISMLNREDLPGMEDATAALKSGSMILGQLEAKLAQISPAFATERGKRALGALQAAEKAILLLTEDGTPEALRAIGIVRQQQFRTLLEAQVAKVRNIAVEAAARITDDTPEARMQIGLQGHAAASSALAGAREMERDLWGRVAQDIPSEATSILARYNNARSELLRSETMNELVEKEIALMRRDIANGVPPMTAGDLIKFRSRMLANARDLAANPAIPRHHVRQAALMAEAAMEDLERMGVTQFGGMDAKLAYDAARVFSRELHDVFSRTFAGRVDETTARGGARYAPEMLMDQAFATGGAAGFLRMRELDDATRFMARQLPDSPEMAATVEMMQDAQSRMLRIAASVTIDPVSGRVNQRSLVKFISDHEAVINRFPAVRRFLVEATQSEAAARRVEQMQKGVPNLIAGRAAFEKVANIESTTEAVTRALRGDNPVRDLLGMTRLAGRDHTGAAQEGLTSAVWGHAFKQASKDGVISFELLEKVLSEPFTKGGQSLLSIMQRSGLMKGPQLADAKKLFDRAIEIERLLKTQAGIEELMGNPDALTDLVIRISGARLGAAGAVGAASGSTIVAAGAGVRFAQKMLSKLPTATITNILIEASLNPELMKDLLARGVRQRGAVQFANTMHAYLLTAGIFQNVDGDAVGDQLSRAFQIPEAHAASSDLTPLEQSVTASEFQANRGHAALLVPEDQRTEEDWQAITAYETLFGASPDPSTIMPPLTERVVGRTDEGRNVYENTDGSFSSERSITVDDPRINGGKWTNIPTIFEGKEVPHEQAVARIIEAGGKDPETGRVLPGFETSEEAVAAAQERSEALSATIGPRSGPDSEEGPPGAAEGGSDDLSGGPEEDQGDVLDENAFRDAFTEAIGDDPDEESDSLLEDIVTTIRATFGGTARGIATTIRAPFDGTARGAAKAAASAIMAPLEVLKGLGSADAGDAVEALRGFIDGIDDLGQDQADDAPFAAKLYGILGEILGQFIGPVVGITKKIDAVTQLGALPSALVADALVGFFARSGDEGNLGNLMEDNDFMADLGAVFSVDAGDSDLEARIKNMGETMVTFGIAQGTIDIVKQGLPILVKTGRQMAGGARQAMRDASERIGTEAQAGVVQFHSGGPSGTQIAAAADKALEAVELTVANIRDRVKLPRKGAHKPTDNELSVVAGVAKTDEEAQVAVDTISRMRSNYPVGAGKEKFADFEVVGGKFATNKDGSLKLTNGKPTFIPKIKEQPYGFGPPKGTDRKVWGKKIEDATIRDLNKVVRDAQAGDASAIAILAEARWYRDMRKSLRREFGGMGDVFADILGATSAQTPVKMNFANAIDVLKRFSRGDFEAELLAWERRAASGETMNPSKLQQMHKSGEFPLISKAAGALYGANSPATTKALIDTFRLIVPGKTAPKTINFTGNLIGYSADGTIDVWAARYLRNKAGLRYIPPPAEKAVSGKHTAKSSFGDPKIGGEFGFGQEILQNVANRVNKSGLITGFDPSLGKMGADDMQAVLWFLEKRKWTQRGWTSKAGEGGSLDLEMKFAGSDNPGLVESLRAEAGQTFKPPVQRVKETSAAHAARVQAAKGLHTQVTGAASARLEGLKARADRTVLGISAGRPGHVPSHVEQAEVAAEFDDVVRADPSVIAHKTNSTDALYNSVNKRSIDAEFITRKDFDPQPLTRRLVEVAKAKNQDSAFIAKVLRPGFEEAGTNQRATPGLEVYFKTKRSAADAKAFSEKLKEQGIDGFTLVTDARRADTPSAQLAAGGRDAPEAVGVRVLYVPAFDGGFDVAKTQAARQKFHELAIELERTDPSISAANMLDYQLDLFHRGDTATDWIKGGTTYDDYLGSSGRYSAPPGKVR